MCCSCMVRLAFRHGDAVSDGSVGTMAQRTIGKGGAASDGTTWMSRVERLAPQINRSVVLAIFLKTCHLSTPMGSAVCKAFGCCCSGAPRLPPTPELPVPAGKTRMCIAGWNASPNAGLAHEVATAVAKKYPDKYESWFHWDQNGPCPACCCNNNYEQYIIERTAHETFPPALQGKASHYSFQVPPQSDPAATFNAATPIIRTD